jgi:acyl-coenzyme A synthetase/AMP-(fatty) acid ligase
MSACARRSGCSAARLPAAAISHYRHGHRATAPHHPTAPHADSCLPLTFPAHPCNAGDIGWRDADGQTRVVDRAKELIKVKGYQCAPAELEGLLVNHPAIADAAVVGAPDARAGEVPVAFVVRRPAAPGAAAKEVTAAEVIEYMKPKVADYKVPAHVVFVEAIPKSAAGKILRRVLKADLAKHLPAGAGSA